MSDKKQELKNAINSSEAYSVEKRNLTSMVDKLGEDDSAHDTIRSLGWRWPVVCIFFLTATACVIGWVLCTRFMTDRDVRVKQLDVQMQIETTRIVKEAK